MIRLAAASCIALIGLSGLANASSGDAWEEFRAEVKAACTALAPSGGALLVEVSPFGSESYGAAIVYQLTEAGLDRYLCIFDKQTQKAELTAALPSAGN